MAPVQSASGVSAGVWTVISLGAMLKKLSGLVDTKDLSARENDFIKSVLARTDDGAHTMGLSPRQVEWIEDLHAKHFG